MDNSSIEIYRHLFASVAEEMGVALRRSAFSPNIKERRDYSCAVFDAGGEMVAQAAHIPVHLGSTPLSVRAAMNSLQMRHQDHVCLNDPFAGGTHIPDVTFVSPVFDADNEVAFFVANRAHHADMGGTAPGSLPLSSHIDEEGIRIPPTPWSDQLRDRILEATRTPDERRGDLRAQVAANRRGRYRLGQYLERRPGLRRFAASLQDYGETMMRECIADMPEGTWGFEDAIESDGFGHGPVRIRCKVRIEDQKAVVDFEDTDDQVEGPVNVPRAVTVSAVYYVFRCLAPKRLPSNGGYMRCIEVQTESGTVVDATYPAPVAIGNVETSQRITDVVLGALSRAMPDRIPAASAGTMNNVAVGTEHTAPQSFTYYETIAGGSGASAGFDGCDAVQTHMTNTLNTPIEALEHSYPFRVEAYSLRDGSGGEGRHRGGDGVLKRYRFNSPAVVTLMTERRQLRPWGLSGGQPAKTGRNVLVQNGKRRELPAKCTLEVEEGDRIEVATPGGGGYGSKRGDHSSPDKSKSSEGRPPSRADRGES